MINKLLKNSFAFIAAAAVSVSAVSADVTVDKADIVSETGIMTVSGKCLPNDKILVRIMSTDESVSESDRLIYVMQKNVSDSEYAFGFNISSAAGSMKNGGFEAIVTDSSDNSDSVKFFYYEDSVITSLRGEINPNVGNTAHNDEKINKIKEIIFGSEENRNALLSAYEPFETASDSSVRDNFCTLMSYSKTFSDNSNLREAMKKYSVIAVIGNIESGKIDGYLNNYGADLKYESPSYTAYCAFSEQQRKSASDRLALSNRPFEKESDFESAFDTAVIITELESVNGSEACKKILSKYPNYFNLSGVNANGYGELMSRITAGRVSDIKTIAQILSAYSTEDVKPGGSTGGSSGRGGSSVSAPGTSTVPGEVKPDNTKSKFSDMSGYEWADEAVQYLLENGIVNGVSLNEFAPSVLVTRAQMCKMLCLGLKLNSYETNAKKFADVPPGSWYGRYVDTMSSLGIVNGVSDTSFEPDSYVTREDMAVMAYRALGARNIDISASEAADFADFDSVSDYASEAVTAFKSSKILNGDENGNFNPKSSATRAQAAKFIYEIIKQGGLSK